MSWAEDMGYDAYDFEDYVADYQCYWSIVWEELQEKGYIWQDAYGRQYREKDISNRYLRNILKFCETRFRPKEQIDMLKQIAEKRGIKL